MKHLQIIVHGKVHGVWFRKSTMDQALKHNIKGIVLNQADGTVYIEAEGSADDLESFVQWCQSGPELAKVINLTITEDELKGFQDFKIVY